MAPSNAFALIFAFISATRTLAIGTNDQINANISYGTFANPSANVRPRFRYWVPDATVNLSQVTADVQNAGEVGAGGVELLGYYLYGDIELPGIVPTDWATYGWGTTPWRQVQDTVLEAAQQNGLIVDLALGPNQGAGVPAPTDSDGLLWDLAAFNITIALGGTYNDILPGWNTGPLVSASTGLIVSSTNISRTLSTSSLQDVTSQVGANGQLQLNFPVDANGENYTLFAYYLVHSEAREQQTPLNVVGVKGQPENYVQNGSWVVDHFAAKGAQTTIDFWEEYLLNGNNTKQLLSEVGNYVWEDSMEYEGQVYVLWTPDLANMFLADRGYSVNKYMPIIYTSRTEDVSFASGPSYYLTRYITDESDSGDSYVQDYRQTITEAYEIYLQTISNWAQDTLGLQFSQQVGYNIQVDMLAAIPYVNAPECETLGFGHLIDGYRQYAGPANLAGKRVISSECGANEGEAYQQTIPELLWDVKRSVAGGVNNFIFHGYPYSGDYPNTTWPVFTTFDFQFSEMHGRHQPAWDFYSDFMNWTARTQYIAQTGTPKIDLAFWLKSTDYANDGATFSPIHSMYNPTDLQQAGFTYEYISPDNFNLPFANVVNATLAPERQAFKAIVVRANDTMTASGVAKLAQFALQGLPVFFSGGIPSNISGANETARIYVNTTLDQLISLSNVHLVSYDYLAQSILSSSIQPRTAITANTTWYTYWREDTVDSIDYVYIYNDATGLPRGSGYSTGSITFDSIGVPFTYDAWTGSVTPILSFTQTASTTTIPLQLAGNQTMIIGLHRSQSTFEPQTHIIDSPAHNTFSFSGQSICVFPGSPARTLTLSNGTTISFSTTTAETVTLGPWNLILESWTRPSNLFSIDTIATKTNTTYNLPSLLPWSSISSSLQNVSGRGYYSTSFTWPPSSPASGAFIDLGAIVHSVRVWVNGHVLPPLDVTAAKADIGKFLVEGINEVEVVVASPLGNALRAVWDELLASGQAPAAAVPGVAEYGLVGDVRIVPYMSYEIGV